MEPGERPPRRRAGVPRWVLLLVAGVVLFGAGLAAGRVLVPGQPEQPGTAAAPSSSSAASSSPSEAAASGAPVPVPQACVQAGEAAQQALDAVDRAGGALAELDAVSLDQIIDGLQPLREQLPGQVAACRAASGSS
ncbi:hypothetical protein ACUN7V_10555 [Quadrisphaera oryzae]|uniref:hypothetical protein n=1 Tax=Quadrisphaera TaxID=317661 RepID=UPI0016485776|nr:hypothetical protein [Quadrisphaera sp. RL12-1S]